MLRWPSSQRGSAPPIVASRVFPTRRPTSGEGPGACAVTARSGAECDEMQSAGGFVGRQISSSASLIYQTGYPRFRISSSLGLDAPPSPPACVCALRAFRFSQSFLSVEQREVWVGKQHRVILPVRQWLLTGAAARLGLETKFDLLEPDFCLRSSL